MWMSRHMSTTVCGFMEVVTSTPATCEPPHLTWQAHGTSLPHKVPCQVSSSTLMPAQQRQGQGMAWARSQMRGTTRMWWSVMGGTGRMWAAAVTRQRQKKLPAHVKQHQDHSPEDKQERRPILGSTSAAVVGACDETSAGLAAWRLQGIAQLSLRTALQTHWRTSGTWCLSRR